MNNETKIPTEKLVIAFAKMIGAFAILAISIAFGGYVVMYLWNGIIPPTFGLSTITWAQATGIDVLISFIVAQRKADAEESLVYTFVYVISQNLLFMIIGWIVMQFI